MVIERKWFPLTNELGIEIGDRVRFEANPPSGIGEVVSGLARRPGDPGLRWPYDVTTVGRGVVTNIWLGIEEVIDIDAEVPGTFWTEKIHLYPMVDRVEKVRGVPR